MAELRYLSQATRPMMSRRHHRGRPINIVDISNVPSAPEPKDYSHYHISIEGNIGCGKSTVIRELARRFGHDIMQAQPVVFPEPIEEWIDYGINHTNLLMRMYDTEVAWTSDCQAFQLVAMLSKVRQIGKRDELKFVERSLDSQLEVFIPVLKIQNKITDLDCEILIDSIRTYQDHIPNVNPDLYVYLEMAPEIALHRIRARDRMEEKYLNLEYLKMLNDQHDKWLKAESKNNILIVNINEHTPLDFNHIIDLIKNRLDTIIPNVLKH